MPGLAVCIDQIALLRQSRHKPYPDPVTAAAAAEMAGADAIIVHLREDRLHTQDRDVRILRKTVQTKLILRMATTSEMLGSALEIKPDRVILVPERTEELSETGGLDLIVHKEAVVEIIGNLQNSGIPVGIFIDPQPEQIKLAHQCKANYIEVNAGPFCAAATQTKRVQTLNRIVDTVKLAPRLRQGVYVGGGIDYQNIKAFKGLKEVNTFNVGHSIAARAVMSGMGQAVKDMVALINSL
jgi:pyridoxine 5-phosphate synthase